MPPDILPQKCFVMHVSCSVNKLLSSIVRLLAPGVRELYGKLLAGAATKQLQALCAELQAVSWQFEFVLSHVCVSVSLIVYVVQLQATEVSCTWACTGAKKRECR